MPQPTTITLPEEDDVDCIEISPLERGLRNFRQARSQGRPIPFIDLTQNEQGVHECELQVISELNTAHAFRRSATLLRNPEIPIHFQLSTFRHENMLIKKGTLVEVTQRSEEKHSWQFLQVGNIYIDARSGQVTIRGIRLTRHRYLRGLLPRLKNELCALYDIDKSDDRPEHIQAAEEILVTEVLRTRAFSRTNDAFPRHRFNRRQWESIEDIESKGILVQRWKYCRYWPSSAAMATKRSYSGAVVRLTYADIEDEYFRVADDKLRNEFRGGIIRGGSFINGRVCTPTIDLDQGVARASPSYQKYTADDIFCGAGGATCGFRRAGLQVRLACDMDHTATSSYRANFPEALLKVKNIFDLIEELRNSTDRSDIVHISPPCQVFSPVHTRPGKNDDANVAALFACGEILKTRRPRISTGEQTFGLLHPHNEEFFNALVGQYTTLGFSFSWDILRFKEYGVPSIRRRLIWIASCPGELLPSFPHPTHVEGSINLPAPVTLRDVLRSVQPGHNDPLHNVESMIDRARSSIKFPREPYDDRIQIGTVTTAGSEVAHPSGRRNFTARELALIQGFPKRHKFVGSITQINRQIGNAFPPVVVEALYGHIRKWLLRQDRVVPRNIGTLETSSVVTREHRCRQNVVILDPIEETTVVSQLSRRQIPIIIDDDQDDEYRVQEVRVSSSGQDTGYQVHDSEDADMIDIDQARRNISRESSRTLSVESLPSLIEIE